MKTLLCLFVFAIGSAAHADSVNPPRGITLQSLFSWTNDRDANKDSFNLMIDDKDLVAGMFLKLDSGQTDGTDGTFWERDIESTDGALVLEGQGHKVMFLLGKLDRASQEGRFSLKYLANGLTNQFSTCDFLLKKDGNAWYVKNAYNGQKVTQMKIITWGLGLKTLQGICQ